MAWRAADVPTPYPSPKGAGRRALLLALLLLAACGKQGKLTPVAPRPAPVQPANAPKPVTPEQRLKLAPQAQPTRVDDPVRRSEERPDDRFNLPPPSRD